VFLLIGDQVYFAALLERLDVILVAIVIIIAARAISVLAWGQSAIRLPKPKFRCPGKPYCGGGAYGDLYR
jgi:NhaP-type Na+/H+ or K+/H+ antiporter